MSVSKTEQWEQGKALTTNRIQTDPAVIMGKAVIHGTWITVELILRKLAEGATEASYSKIIPT